MPENFTRATARSREKIDKVESNLSQTLDLTALTDQEEKIIQSVLQKDEIERNILDAKISEVRKEIQEIRKASALTAEDDQNAICARCKTKFMPFLLPWADHGQRCITCKFRVCAKCCTKQSNGSWLCILCFKYRQEKLLTGEWISKGQSSNLYGTELMRASLRDRNCKYSKFLGIKAWEIKYPINLNCQDFLHKIKGIQRITFQFRNKWKEKYLMMTIIFTVDITCSDLSDTSFSPLEVVCKIMLRPVSHVCLYWKLLQTYCYNMAWISKFESQSYLRTMESGMQIGILILNSSQSFYTEHSSKQLLDIRCKFGRGQVGRVMEERFVVRIKTVSKLLYCMSFCNNTIWCRCYTLFRKRYSTINFVGLIQEKKFGTIAISFSHCDTEQFSLASICNFVTTILDFLILLILTVIFSSVTIPVDLINNNYVNNTSRRNTNMNAWNNFSQTSSCVKNRMFSRAQTSSNIITSSSNTAMSVTEENNEGLRLLRQMDMANITGSVRDTLHGNTDDNTNGISSNEQLDRAPVNHVDHLSVPAIAVTSQGGEDSRESIYSIYSDAGEVNYGRIRVTGEIMFSLIYSCKSNILEVHIIQCKDLAPVDSKHNRSDPYVKTYLLPDKSRGSKRKTRIKKHTLNPVFDEILKYQISQSELVSRSLSLTVWHNDRFGRNDFLGEVTISLDYYSYDDNAPRWYPLQERAISQDPLLGYKGDLFISVKYVTMDMLTVNPKKKIGSSRKKNKEKEKLERSLGEVHVLIKEAQNLTAMRGSAGSDPFCKGYLLPDVSHTSKQKTPVIKKTTNPQWQHILVFEGVDQNLLPHHGLELTIWDHDRLSSNDFLGGVRLSLGQGTHQDKPVDWMDSRGEEIEAWQSMIDHPNEWVDIQLPLRVSMDKQSVKKWSDYGALLRKGIIPFGRRGKVMIRETNLMTVSTSKMSNFCVDTLNFDENSQSWIVDGEIVCLDETKCVRLYPQLETCTLHLENTIICDMNHDSILDISSDNTKLERKSLDIQSSSKKSQQFLEDKAFAEKLILPNKKSRLENNFPKGNLDGAIKSSFYKTEHFSKIKSQNFAEDYNLASTTGESVHKSKSNKLLPGFRETHDYNKVNTAVCCRKHSLPTFQQQNTNVRKLASTLETNLHDKPTDISPLRRNVPYNYENKYHTGLMPSAPPSEDVSESDTFSSWSFHQDHNFFPQVLRKECFTDSSHDNKKCFTDSSHDNSLTGQIYHTPILIASSDQTHMPSALESLHTQTYSISKPTNSSMYTPTSNPSSPDITAGIFHYPSSDLKHSQQHSPQIQTSNQIPYCSHEGWTNHSVFPKPLNVPHISTDIFLETPTNFQHHNKKMFASDTHKSTKSALDPACKCSSVNDILQKINSSKIKIFSDPQAASSIDTCTFRSSTSLSPSPIYRFVKEKSYEEADARDSYGSNLSPSVCVTASHGVLPTSYKASTSRSKLVKLISPIKSCKQPGHLQQNPSESSSVEHGQNSDSAQTKPEYVHFDHHRHHLVYKHPELEMSQYNQTLSSESISSPKDSLFLSEPLYPSLVYNYHMPQSILSSHVTEHIFTPVALKPIIQHISQESENVSKDRLQEIITRTVENMVPEASEDLQLGLQDFLNKEFNQLNLDNDILNTQSKFLEFNTGTTTSDNMNWLSVLISLLPNLETMEVFMNSILEQLTQDLFAELHGLTVPSEVQGSDAETVEIPSTSVYVLRQIKTAPETNLADSCAEDTCLLSDTSRSTLLTENKCMPILKPSAHRKEQCINREQLSSTETSVCSEYKTIKNSPMRQDSLNRNLYQTASESSVASYASVISPQTSSFVQDRILHSGSSANRVDTPATTSHENQYQLFYPDPNTSDKKSNFNTDKPIKLSQNKDFNKHGQNTNVTPYICNSKNKHTLQDGCHSQSSISSDSSKQECYYSNPSKDLSNSFKINACVSCNKDHISCSLHPRMMSQSCQSYEALLPNKISDSDSTVMSGRLSSCFEDDETSLDEGCSELEYSILPQESVDSKGISQKSFKCHKTIQVLQESLSKCHERVEEIHSVDNSLAGLDSFPQDTFSNSTGKSSSFVPLSLNKKSVPYLKNIKGILQPTPILVSESLSLGRIFRRPSYSNVSEIQSESQKLPQQSLTSSDVLNKPSKPKSKPPILLEPKRKPPILPEPKRKPPILLEPKRKAPILPEPKREGPILPEPKREAPILPEPKKEAPMLPEPKREAPILPEPKREAPMLPEPKREAPILPEPKREAPILPEPKRKAPILPQPKRKAPILSEAVRNDLIQILKTTSDSSLKNQDS